MIDDSDHTIYETSTSSGAPQNRLARLGNFARIAAKSLLPLGIVAAVLYALYAYPPLQNIPRGEVGVRLNQITGTSSSIFEGTALVIPGLHSLRRLPMREQIYRPNADAKTQDKHNFQSLEGLSIGVDLSVRYAIDPAKLAEAARNLPENIGSDAIAPALDGVLYKILARYTVREIFSVKRQEIKDSIENELRPLLAQDGLQLKSILIGKIDLPKGYKVGMESLLGEELASEKMRYTLALKEKQVLQSGLEADAAKVQREKLAEAAGEEQIIAAKAQAEAMKHILPFKQKQIEQRRLEAEADKVARIKEAEGNAQARQIEAAGEAEARRKLADAGVYRQEKIGLAVNAQMSRDGALLSRHPLLIQKAMVDKLSDKISVIIAPPPTDGGFIGQTLLGKAAPGNPTDLVEENQAGEQ